MDVAAGSRDQPNMRAQSTMGLDSLTRPSAGREVYAELWPSSFPLYGCVAA